MCERTEMVATSEKQRRVHRGCDISFVVLAPFELTGKRMLGEVSFKELSTIFVPGKKKKKKKHTCMCAIRFCEFLKTSSIID